MRCFQRINLAFFISCLTEATSSTNTSIFFIGAANFTPAITTYFRAACVALVP
jgi:hypothetical protein